MSQNESLENKQDISLSLAEANLYTILVTLPIVLPLLIFFYAIWGFKPLLDGLLLIYRHIIIFLLLVIAGIFVHEYLHKISWAIFGKKPLSTITFGFQLKTLTPYTHCKESMDVVGYRWGALMPGLLLGILPTLIAIFNGDGSILIYGLLFIFTAGGDFLILWLIRNVKNGTQVEDHPSRAGCYVLEKA